MARIDVIGCDAGAPDTMAAPQRQLLSCCDCLLAPRRVLEQLQPRPDTQEVHGMTPLDAALGCLSQRHRQGKHCVVLTSGDPLWFGLGRLLLQLFPSEDLVFHPAATSMQQLFARLKRPWQDATWVSLHGRDADCLVAPLRRHPSALVVLTDPCQGGPADVVAILRSTQTINRYDLWLAERLGHSTERLRQVQPDALPTDVDPLSLMVLLRRPNPRVAPLPWFGLEDGIWRQHEDHPGLMTKREVRVLLLAELDLPPSGVMWDLGAGVGSVGLEAMRLRPQLELHAVERRVGAVPLIRRNACTVGCDPQRLHVHGASALAVLHKLPDPDRVLIGGGGDRRTVLEQTAARLKPGGRIVLPLATLEAFASVQRQLKDGGLEVHSLQVQISRGCPVGGHTRLQPLNPVFIVSGRFPQRDPPAN
ncbi:bifunctional cobalt-precorrin-7 (C(5))-methyltransferase/cobalt-precorrin-6B (C(15))-methyltransferase [Candidatus Synechococcus spongiarum]|uniref:Cobalt-precorrin-7 (C5)-methyltransferase n=1 Tax=Candidatus Synechococcus spongiarum TaxID=431041 RepID=A0A171DHM0_9SYNE|nr:bifunctional cobalt-precorrin-7 (C(5))-methyltransferase/cobalt-precorrin-6B (C(15))-methyltransferase [Candidatus Synechococcus spongiarum]SAY39310.1 Cobalt-precorrin-7 (C5)-methyltransferase (EC 2.1.1.289) / Cobalt-precorrin-6B C15-methyltransferase [decarboxylating] (EC 2.1.1.196) [Candidatus Synechococcus spongiarum]